MERGKANISITSSPESATTSRKSNDLNTRVRGGQLFKRSRPCYYCWNVCWKKIMTVTAFGRLKIVLRPMCLCTEKMSCRWTNVREHWNRITITAFIPTTWYTPRVWQVGKTRTFPFELRHWMTCTRE